MVTEVVNIDAIRKGCVLADFYTSTCGPCRALNPILEEISQEFKNLMVAKIEVTKNPIAAQMYGVMSVPTVMFLKDSKVKGVSRRFSGKEAIRSMVQKSLAE